jgi:tetratricopeptide (TPR) repeat protein
VLLRESQTQPLLLVFEDLHWIDTETQALLDRLVDGLPTARILLLVNYRPEYQHGWGSKTYYTQLRLDPLPPAGAAEVLQALLGDDPSLAPLKALLIARTEGNPFFLEESVRTLVETGVLTGEPGAYRLAQALPTIQVPATVQAVLAARIDRLPPEEKRLLQTAAVIGTEVPLPLLQAIAELPEDALHRGLTHLQAAEFLYETRLFPEREYTFKHALTHEVAYGSLLLERRRMLHARIVEALEALTGDRLAEQVERLAHHALRGDVWDKALAYFRQAGERAVTRSAHREAAEYFEQALRALGHLPEERETREQAIDLRLALRSALLPSGDFGRILAVLREAESLMATLDDPRRLGRVSRFLSGHFYFMGALDQAITAAQRALTLATASGEVVLQALANQYLGRAYRAQGDYRRAIDCLRQTVTFFDGARSRERFGLPFLPAVTSRADLAACHAELGTFAEGIALGEEGLRVSEVVAHPGSLMFGSWGIGLLTLRQGDLPRALPLLERAVGICQDADLPLYFPGMAAALGAAYTLDGRIADAVPLLTQAMEQTMAMETARFQALCRLPLGEAHLLAGRLEEAYALAEGALALASAHQERGHQAYALRLLGDIAARREHPERAQAEAYYRQALALVEELGMRPLQAHCHRGLGTLYAKRGQWEQARTELCAALDLYQAMAMTFWLPQVEAVLVQAEER